MPAQSNFSTIFHITHWKAGSQWLHKILLDLVPERVIPPEVDEKQFLNRALVPAAVYPTLYVTREQFYSAALPLNHRKFVIIRDLRDTLVSGYFSIRYGHPSVDDRLAIWREHLSSLTLEAGLCWTIDKWLHFPARIQASWLGSEEKVIRYEALLDNDLEILYDVLVNFCEIQVSSDKFSRVISENRFETMAGGRNRGTEDAKSHARNGVAGDWRNYFTSSVENRFNQCYGSLLAESGYT